MKGTLFSIYEIAQSFLDNKFCSGYLIEFQVVH